VQSGLGTSEGVMSEAATPPQPMPLEEEARARPSLRTRLLREPLVHFLLAGLALFAVYRLLHPEAVGDDASSHIVLTPDDLRQMSVAWLAQGRPPPTPEEMRSLVANRVREEILFREALALGLDQDDTIVRRRMVQKMEFLAQDMADLRDPSRAELETWFRQHAGRFAEPPRATFRNLYFSPDRRGAGARAAAQAALATLAGKPMSAPEAGALADPFMFQDYYPERTTDQVAKDFGPAFARALFEIEPGSWQGPIESGYGWHLLWVESFVPARVPTFEEVEPEVREAWVEEQRAEFERKAFDRMKARYTVVVPDDLSPAPIGVLGSRGEER
jgi:peptidyl-prolyl cis-trans isomerase C